jgi:hypothetical protein
MVDDIDIKWNEVYEWWENINIENNIFLHNIKKPTHEEKNIFNIKLLYIIKQLFNIEDINNINKLTKININVLNFDNLNLLTENNNELKNIIQYLLPYNIYYNKLKQKVIDIFTFLINDKNFNNMFKYDDDLTRLFAPFGASFLYIYIITRDIEKTINLFLKLDNNGIIFFIISYSILDNLMDDINELSHTKNIFLKWFMNIVNNPNNEIILNKDEQQIWQCTTFAKYFILFRIQYPVNKHIILYDFIKTLILELNKANVVQQNILSTEEQILKHSFKKSFAAFFFTVLLINEQFSEFKNSNLKQNMDILYKLLFLIQLYDDFSDIDKDILEKNYTYLNSNNIILPLNDRIRKIIIASFKLIDELDETDNNILNIIYYTIINVNFGLSFYHLDKINYFFEYSLLSPDSLKLFNKNIYNLHTSNLIIQYLYTLKSSNY